MKDGGKHGQLLARQQDPLMYSNGGPWYYRHSIVNKMRLHFMKIGQCACSFPVCVCMWSCGYGWRRMPEWTGILLAHVSHRARRLGVKLNVHVMASYRRGGYGMPISLGVLVIGESIEEL